MSAIAIDVAATEVVLQRGSTAWLHKRALVRLPPGISAAFVCQRLQEVADGDGVSVDLFVDIDKLVADVLDKGTVSFKRLVEAVAAKRITWKTFADLYRGVVQRFIDTGVLPNGILFTQYPILQEVLASSLIFVVKIAPRKELFTSLLLQDGTQSEEIQRLLSLQGQGFWCDNTLVSLEQFTTTLYDKIRSVLLSEEILKLSVLYSEAIDAKGELIKPKSDVEDTACISQMDDYQYLFDIRRLVSELFPVVRLPRGTGNLNASALIILDSLPVVDKLRTSQVTKVIPCDEIPMSPIQTVIASLLVAKLSINTTQNRANVLTSLDLESLLVAQDLLKPGVNLELDWCMVAGAISGCDVYKLSVLDRYGASTGEVFVFTVKKPVINSDCN